MLPLTALKSMKVMFATPCYISGVSMNYVASIFSLTLDSAHVGLPCILHLHSESLITRGRNKIVIKFLSDDFTHLFWIDSDIAFSSQSVFRLLLADRDVAAGVYPMKSFNWPAEGVPAGMTRKQFETAYTDYPFNPIEHGKNSRQPVRRQRWFRRGGGSADRLHGDQAPRILGDDEALSGTQLCSRRPAQQSAGASALAFLRLHGRSGFRALPVRGLRLLPPLARHGREDLGRSRLQAHASRPAPVQRRPRRKPARTGALVRVAGASKPMRERAEHVSHLLRCMSPVLAHRVVSPRRINSVAIGGIADIARSTAALGPTRMTRTGHRRPKFAVMHNTVPMSGGRV